MEAHETDEPQENNRARALIAIASFAAFGVLIAVIVVLGGGGEENPDFVAAPQACVDSWNDDAQAVSTGVHNSVSHSYTRVQIAYSSPDGAEVGPDPIQGGGCIVVFAAQALDPEPFAAAEINLGKHWVPLTGNVGLDKLAVLQSDAITGANAELGTDGKVTPLEDGAT